MRRRNLVPLAFLTLALGCSKLTAPPSPEPIASDTTTTAASARPAATPAATPTQTAPAPAPTQDEAEAKLGIEDVTVGTGDAVKDGDTVTVHYIGTFEDGKKFDASRDHPAMGDQPAGAPFKVTIGQGNVIKGWDQGIPGMKVGGKRKLKIPYQLAYGERGRPGIPPKATLLFEIDLLKIEKK
jgi:FKBP-type peptidyl-prolyl cis-trans isomerase